MLAGISIRLHKLVSNLEACSMRSSTQRVACMLQHYAPEKGAKRYDIELPAAKHTVASQLNLTPETFSPSRRAVSPALYYLKPTKINEDNVVPRTKITEMLRRLRMLSEKSGITIVNFGHAGDGNIHVNIMVDRADEEEYKKGLALVEQIFRETLDLGGTITGEHGIGLTKAKYISMELDRREIAIMESIKKVFDTKNILNPGKIFS